MSNTPRPRTRKPRAPKAERRRDYSAEYPRRIHRGLSKGLSRSQARGHARAGERPKPTRPIIDPKGAEERAIRAMMVGFSLRESARLYGLSEQHLRRYVKENVGAKWERRRWIFDDQRARQFPVYSEGQLKTLTLKPFEASSAGLFMNAVRRFLSIGDRQLLAPYEGQGVKDVNGRFHRFETDPNRLYELDARGELNFPEIYRITA
jgi:hypothetical protein